MVSRKNKIYDLRYEVASERKTVTGFTLIPASDSNAKLQHMTEDEKFKKIQRHALNGELEKVKLLLSEFPVYKREDLKKMLILSASDRGLDLEI